MAICCRSILSRTPPASEPTAYGRRRFDDLTRALEEARTQKGPSVVVVETALEARVGSYESWWDVPVAEVSETESAKDVYQKYAAGRAKERFLGSVSSADSH